MDSESKIPTMTEEQIDAVVDQAVDHAALMEERQMAMALWKMMTTRKGRRKPHRSFACQQLPEVAAKRDEKRRRLQKLARRARKATYRNCH